MMRQSLGRHGVVGLLLLAVVSPVDAQESASALPPFTNCPPSVRLNTTVDLWPTCAISAPMPVWGGVCSATDRHCMQPCLEEHLCAGDHSRVCERITYDYDAEGRWVAAGHDIEHVVPPDGVVEGSQQREYDNDGRIVSHFVDGVYSSPVLYTYERPDERTVVITSSRDGSAARYSYDTFGRLVRLEEEEHDRVSEIAYDDEGRIERMTFNTSETATYTYDATGRVVQIDVVSAEGESISRDQFVWTDAGRLEMRRLDERSADGGEMTLFATQFFDYDASGRVVEVRFRSSAVADWTYRWSYECGR